MSARLFFTVGLPGSGKTTVALKGVAHLQAYGHGAVEISRDGIRQQYYGKLSGLTQEQENEVTSIEHAQINKALERGFYVWVHDCNLRMGYRKALAQMAENHGVGWQQVNLTHVPLDVCLERNRNRDTPVPEEVIRNMYNRYLKSLKGASPAVPVVKERLALPRHELYVPDTNLPGAVLVDVDGTVALHEGVRGPYDTSRYHLDRPNVPIIDMVRHEAYDLGNLIVFGSGRNEKFREVTMEWLFQEVKVPIAGMFMRGLNDTRNDAIVKLELFDTHIRNSFNIKRVYDDRNRVVAAYRSIGLPVLQVADGDF